MRPFALDLDGTLIDCRHRQVAIAADLVPALDEERFWAAKRSGATTRAALAALDVAEADAVAAAWGAQVEDPRWLVLDAPLPGAPEALAAIRAAGAAPVVVTARRDARAVRAQVARLALDVDAVHVVDPRRAADEKAAVLADLDAAAYVGDTDHDQAAARRAGVPFVAVSSGQRDRAALAAREVAPVYEGVADAVAALLAGLQTT